MPTRTETQVGKRLAGLSDSKRELLKARLRGKDPAADSIRTGTTAAASTPRTDRAPLSWAQRNLWFFSQLQPESPVYNTAVVFRLKGALRCAALQEALNLVVGRHESLRTRYVVEPGADGPVQVVSEPGPVPLEEFDLSGEPVRRREEMTRRTLAEVHRRPFRLDRDLMLRAALIREGQEDWVLTLVMHHIASDLRSWRILFDELSAAYRDRLAKRSSSLPPLIWQYADHALAEPALLATPAVAAQLAYWKERLADAPAIIDLPTDQPRPPSLSFRGAMVRAMLAPPLVERLQAIGRQEGCTLFMTLLAAFKTHLFRLTQQPDLIVGVPTAGRANPLNQPLIGLFINMVPVRSNLAGNPSFREFLRQVRDSCLDALHNQDVPFGQLVEELRPPRSGSHSPLIQVMFTLQDATETGAEFHGLEVTPVEADMGAARFDLTLLAEHTAAGLRLSLEYGADLFEERTARRMLGQYVTVLQSVADDPDRRLMAVSMLEPAERRRMLEDWNRTQLDFPREEGIHGLFEKQAQRAPAAVALVAGRERVTYAELDERANRLAERLRAAGAGRGKTVAIFMSRSAEMVVAMLAVLKSGAAYVPLDPAYPAERVAFILSDAQTPIVVTEAALRARLPAHAGRILAVDEPGPAGPLRPGGEQAPAGGGDLAYIIYTSGSTGRPKGVALEHRNAVAFIAWAHTVFSPRELDGVFAGTSICFDLSIFEIFVPLARGGKVILAENALALPSLAAADEIRLINTVPSAMAELNRLNAIPPSVETVNLAGEPLPQALVDELYARPHVRRVYDLYGPTETTTYSTFALRRRGGRPTIGRPIGNTRVYLLDAAGEPVPVGVPGELHIGGAGVARGYLGRPQLTAERFLPDPFAGESGGRMYRTGDLCRFRPDGTLEYLSRIDDQVKIRGFRIELGEVEAALLRHPAIKEALATAQDDAVAGRRLVAYVAPKAEPLPAAELRAFLQQSLPEPMIPSAIVSLDRLPRSPNGKIDRARLPQPDASSSAGGREPVAPRDELEAKLVAIWESVLRTSPVGVMDRFFELGGHSLLAVRVAAKIEATLGCKLPVAAVFQAPTIAEMAALIRQGVDRREVSVLIPIQPWGTRPPLFLVHAMGGGGLWAYGNIARVLGDDQPVYTFRAAEPSAPGKFLRIEEMAASYVRAMRELQPVGPYFLGGYCFGGVVAYEMACQLEAQGQEVGLLALISAWPPNRGHDRMHWTPRTLARFVRNLYPWVRRYGRWDSGMRRRFVRWKAQQALRFLARALGGAPAAEDSRIHRIVDLSAVPTSERPLWDAHLQSLVHYEPRPYAGKVTLLRTRSYPLFSSYEAQHGWDRLAAGGVEVSFVPGYHETLMSEPDVQGAAHALKRHLEA